MKLTYFPSKLNILNHLTVIDAQNKKIGKIASLCSLIVQGKTINTFQNYLIQNNYIIVVNVSKVLISQQKVENKKYYRHSNYIGGLKKETLNEMLEKNPTKVLRLSISKMLPKNSLRPDCMRRIKIYSDNNTPYNLNLFKKIIY